MEIENYTNLGFSYHHNFFNEEELLRIESIVTKFHNSWLLSNVKANSMGTLNSHSLTSSKILSK